jgi:copper resistance protein C
MPNIRATVFALMAVFLCVDFADAHPQLQSAEPAAGETATAPRQIKILFNEAVIPQFSGLELKDQTGKMVATGKPEVDPANTKLLIVPIPEPLPPGDYKVEWHAVSADTHRVKGSYSFGVAH